MINWHQTHRDNQSLSDRLADHVAQFIGSWKFLIIQTVIVSIWIMVNLIGYLQHWDPYPFILLNLVFSTQAAYAAPIIMQSQNRQTERDRHQADADYQCNQMAKVEIEQLQRDLARIENEKLDKLITLSADVKANLARIEFLINKGIPVTVSLG